jgi:gluconolactonase
MGRLTPLSFPAFPTSAEHVQSFPGRQEKRSANLCVAAGEIPQEAPHRVVRAEPAGRAGRQLPRRSVVPFGRIFRIDAKGDWDLVIQYDGWPNGLKIHKDGRIFVADYRKGLLVLDPRSGKLEAFLETAFSEGFKGLNDLHFADNGDLYFTDQGQSGIADPSGRVYRLRTGSDGKAGELQRLVANAPSPNGITLNTKNNQVYVAMTRAQQIWRLPLMAGGTPSKTGVAIQLSGGHAGPDGIEMDAEDGLIVCQLGVGIWRFDANCLPTHLVHAGKHHRLMTNVAFQGKKLFITDSANGEILAAELPVAGKRMFSHR